MAQEPVYSLVYVSAARQRMSPEMLARVLESSRRNNAALGVTGMLMYASGTFMQALEGEEHVVRALYARICADARHSDPMILSQEHRRGRLFGEWEMGYSGAGMGRGSGFAGCRSLGTLSVGPRNRTSKLLLSFRTEHIGAL